MVKEMFEVREDPHLRNAKGALLVRHKDKILIYVDPDMEKAKRAKVIAELETRANMVRIKNVGKPANDSTDEPLRKGMGTKNVL